MKAKVLQNISCGILISNWDTCVDVLNYLKDVEFNEEDMKNAFQLFDKRSNGFIVYFLENLMILSLNNHDLSVYRVYVCGPVFWWFGRKFCYSEGKYDAGGYSGNAERGNRLDRFLSFEMCLCFVAFDKMYSCSRKSLSERHVMISCLISALISRLTQIRTDVWAWRTS